MLFGFWDILERRSARLQGFFTGVLGVFCVTMHGYSLVTGRGPDGPMPAWEASCFVALAVSFIIAGVGLLLKTSWGWWSAWAAMLATGMSGIAMLSDPIEGFTPIVTVGFMVCAAGVFFCSLSHQRVLSDCFPDGAVPHPVLAGTPCILVALGAVTMCFDPKAIWMAAFFLVILVASGTASWMVRPLFGQLQGGNPSQPHGDSEG